MYDKCSDCEYTNYDNYIQKVENQQKEFINYLEDEIKFHKNRDSYMVVIDDEWITMSDMQVPILKSIANGMIKSVITHEQTAYKVGE